MMNKQAIYFFSAFLAFCSFSYEILLAFVVATLSGATVLAQTVTLGSFILGLGLGAYITDKQSHREPIKKLFQVEVYLALVGGASLFIIYSIHGLYLASFTESARLFIIYAAQPVALIVGWLSGYELPLLIKMGKDVDALENRVLGFHYVGVLLASLVIFTVLLPRLDALGSGLFIAILNSVCAMVLWFKISTRKKYIFATLGVALALLALTYKHEAFYQSYLKLFYHRVQPENWSPDKVTSALEVLRTRPEVKRIRTPYQYIDIIDGQAPELLELENKESPLLLFLNHHPQFSTAFEKVYHEQMVHVPIEFFNSEPRQVLVLGGGDGLIARELLRYPDIHIEMVELDSKMLELFSTSPRLKALNENSLSHERLTLHNTDAISFLKASDTQYDAIFLDFPFPNNYDLSKLYSIEFYRLVEMHLNKDGFVILDFPLDRARAPTTERNEVILSTLYYSGFTNLVPFGKDDTFIMASRGEQSSLDYNPRSDKISWRSGRMVYMRKQLRATTEIHRRHISSMFKPKDLRSIHGGWQ